MASKVAAHKAWSGTTGANRLLPARARCAGADASTQQWLIKNKQVVIEIGAHAPKGHRLNVKLI